MLKMPRNPFQDRINALNSKDLDEVLKTQSYLKQSHEPIQDDINNARYTMTDILPPNVLKPEDLSMKDLLDQIQIQTILNNNTVPFVEKKIKSETTQAMIKEFQNEISKPVEINGTFYKFRPPGVELKIKDLPVFPSETAYKARLQQIYAQEIRAYKDVINRENQIIAIMENDEFNYGAGAMGDEEFINARRYNKDLQTKLAEEKRQVEMVLASIRKDYDNYQDAKIAHDAQVDIINKENKQSLSEYENEIRSRNVGMGAPQREDESDADYAQRMIDTAHETVDPKQVELQAKSFLYNSVKDQLTELIPAYKAEAVLNAIVDAGGYEKLQPIKDQWPMLKKKLEENFGNVARVENTDSIAQVMFYYSMNPVIRTQAPTPSFPGESLPPGAYLQLTGPSGKPSPVRVRTGTTLAQYPRTETTKITAPTFNPPTGTLIETSYSPYPSYAKELSVIPQREIATQNQYERKLRKNEQQRVRNRETSISNFDITNTIPITKLRNITESFPEYNPPYVFQSRQRREGFVPELSLGSSELAIRRNKQYIAQRQNAGYDEGFRTGVEDVRPPLRRQSTEEFFSRPPPLTQRSKSLEQQLQKARDEPGIPLGIILPAQLIEILEVHGLPVLYGHTEESKKQNYESVKNAGLLPPKPKILGRKEINDMNPQQLAEYLASEGMVGSRGGGPFKGDGTRRPDEDLMKIYNRYAVMYGFGMKGSGVDNIKSRFEIIDGEINAGNNNPQLIRDARKLLKEMVTKKMVSLYEAQTHLKHLRKLNKI
jgi:hypothetical protein